MIIRNYPTADLNAQQQSAQGIALGIMAAGVRPARAKALLFDKAFALAGRIPRQRLPVALPWADSSLPLWGVIGHMRIIILFFL